MDAAHICATIRSNFPSEKADFKAQVLEQPENGIKPEIAIAFEAEEQGAQEKSDVAIARPTHLALVATVQFINVLPSIRDSLEMRLDHGQFYDVGGADTAAVNSGLALQSGSGKDEDSTMSRLTTQSWFASPYRITIPQIKPLSSGEILGCTSPNLAKGTADGVDAIIYIGDGRFHLESIMIANPNIPAFRYDPYEKRFVREGYDHISMRNSRARAVKEAKESLQHRAIPLLHVPADQSLARRGWGLILGTLGRQGSTRVLDHLQLMLKPSGINHIPILLSELSPQKLALFGDDLLTFVQTSCPRLSIDWGEAFARPLLSPYEAAVALGEASGWRSDLKSNRADEQTYDRQDGGYPMDFYADQSSGPWTPRHGMGHRSSASRGVSNRELLKRGRLAKRSAAA